MSSARLAGKVAIVAGTGGGIGKAIALMFVRHGACVFGCDLDEAAAEATRAQMRAEARAFDSFHPCHLTDPAYAQGLIDRCVLRFNKIDILVDVGSLAIEAAWPHLQNNGGGSIITLPKADAPVTPRQLAIDGAPFNIRANAITQATAGTPLLQRPSHPDDIAHFATYLASDEASWVTGTTMPIDGGAGAR